MASVVVEVLDYGRVEVRMVGPVDMARRYAGRVMDDDPDRVLLVLAVDVPEDASVADVLEAAGVR